MLTNPIDYCSRSEVQKIVFDMNDVNVESTSINEMPSKSFVDAATSKKMKVDNVEHLKMSWQKQRYKK